MYVYDFIWLPDVVEKLEAKYQVTTDEVEEVFFRDMDENKTREPIPEEFESIEAAASFWDTHSLSDYWDETHEVEIEVKASRRRRGSIAPELWERLRTYA